MTPDSHNPLIPLWRIELFGSLRIVGHARTIERFPTQKIAGLLALLAFYHDQQHTREEIIDILWPEAEPEAGRDRLSQALVWLRRQLEPDGVSRGTVLYADRSRVALQPSAFSSDVADLRAALDEAHRADAGTERIVALSRAVDLCRGELLSGLYADWILMERQRLQNDTLLALRQLAACYEQERDFVRALDCIHRSLAIDSLQEEAHVDLIRLLAKTGQTSAALRQYQELKRLLKNALDIEPSIETQALVARLRTETNALVSPHEPLPSPALPRPLTRLFGREAEIGRVLAQIRGAESRLISLLGTGGVGKTRLALAVAAHYVDEGDGSAAFIPLADLDSASQIVKATLAALGLPLSPAAAPMESMMQALAARPTLLIFDNAEQVLPELSPLLRELLARAPSLTALVTSRQRLGIDGEQELPVPPLPLPEPHGAGESPLDSASVRLFVDRAQAVRPEFALTPANSASVIRICERLDGLPLAIELCAAWASMLSPSQMLERLTHRFDLLISRRTDISARHRTLRAALEYSYLQLSPETRLLFACLSVFRGGWSLEAAEQVCANPTNQDAMATLVGLTELRERSLLTVEEVAASASRDEMRYRMLDTLRDFASEQLSFADRRACRHRHADYFLNLAERASLALTGAEQDLRLSRLDHDYENLCAVLAWSVEMGHVEPGLRLASALGRYWSIRGYLSEGLDWLEQLLAAASRQKPATPLRPAVRASALLTLGHLHWLKGDFPAAQTAHEQALAIHRETGDPQAIATSLYHLGITAYRQDDYARAETYLRESLLLSTELEDQGGIARVLLNLGNLAYEQRQYRHARELLEQSLEIERRLGNRQRVANALNNLGLVAANEQEFELATRLFEEVLAIHRDLKDNYGAAIALSNLGGVVRKSGDREAAWALLKEGLPLADQIGNKHILAFYLLHLGLLAFSEGRYRRSVFLLAAAEHLEQLLGCSFTATDRDDYDRALEKARTLMPPEEYQSAATAGSHLPFARIIDLALAARDADHLSGQS
jgi:predicted ATPase/DNA-binding SARP family transcriptional activator/Tfp pilus assembly protein PilF